MLQSLLPCSTLRIAVIGRSCLEWLRACSNAASAPRDPHSVTSHIFLLTLGRKVICLTCTNSKSAVTKRSLPAKSLQHTTDGTSNMVWVNSSLKGCFKRSPKGATKGAGPLTRVNSKTIPITNVLKHVYQLHPIDIQPWRPVSCIEPGQRRS